MENNKTEHSLKYRYFYDFSGYIITAAVYRFSTGYAVEFSFCSNKDQFVKSLGRKIARGRLGNPERSIVLLKEENPTIENSYDAALVGLIKAGTSSSPQKDFGFPRAIVEQLKDYYNG